MNTFLKFIMGGLISSTCLFVHASDFSAALERHAQSSARDVIGKWIEARTAGNTWSQVLRDHAPKTLDSFCGYRSLVGLQDTGFERARAETEAVVGSRLERTFGSLLSRPSAQLQLVGTTTKGLAGSSQALVTLKVSPARSGDQTLSLLMELDTFGEMVLCDIIPNQKIENGVLSKLGAELNL